MRSVQIPSHAKPTIPTLLALALSMVILSTVLGPGTALATWKPGPELLDGLSSGFVEGERGSEKGAPTHSITYSASKDNTLCEEVTGALSNGIGQYLFAGNTFQMKGLIARRALVAFDVVPSLPSDALISDVRLNLTMSKTIAGALDVGAHRATTDWGEGTSDASLVDAEEGKCAPSTAGDATWTDAVNPGTAWTTAGGDFEASASATTSVAGDGPYVWSGSGMVADVQGWVDGTNPNFGWLVLANESTVPTAKRFNSREHSSEATRPSLTVIFQSALYEVFSDGFEAGNSLNWSTTVGLPENTVGLPE